MSDRWVLARDPREGEIDDAPRSHPASLSERQAALRRMEASDSPLLRDMAAALGGASRGAVCAHGIDTSAGCGRCLERELTDTECAEAFAAFFRQALDRVSATDDEEMGAHFAARFDKGE